MPAVRRAQEQCYDKLIYLLGAGHESLQQFPSSLRISDRGILIPRAPRISAVFSLITAAHFFVVSAGSG